MIEPLKAVVIPKDRRRPEPIMNGPRSVADVLRKHVTLEVEGIDRMYLNVYQPKLQTEKQAACFFRYHRGPPVASSSLMGIMTNAFLRQVDAFVERHDIPVVPFRKGQRAAKINALLRKWLAKLPHPYTPADRQADYRYHVSILQAEFSLTQVLDRPQTGRIFFEEVIRENLDLGRPDQVQLIFGRRVSKRTPGRFRTRVLTAGVIPSLHVEYKSSTIKQYHKAGAYARRRPSTTRATSPSTKG